MSHPIGLRPGDELAGKVALVTGGARNIGRAIARSLAAGGAAVMVHANTSRAEAEETAAMIKKDGGKAAVYLCDVTDPQAVRAMIDATVKQFGRIDCLVNNAVFRFPSASLAEIKFEEWRHALSVVLDGAFLCSQACLPHLLKSGGGSIINMGGLTGHEGAVDHVHLVTPKAGLAGMTKALGRELAPKGITVNCIVPGKIDTVRGMAGTPKRSKEHSSRIPPVGRFGEAGEIAAMVRMLCGPEGRFITGQSIHINGGLLMP